MITLSDNILILSGRVDSVNAAQFEQELFAAWQDGNAIIDAEKLEYISSAGLRVLLKLRKQAGDVTVVNVSPEVYDILEVSGFTEILSVKKALRFVSIEGCEVIGAGSFGTVWKLSDDMIIKTFHSAKDLAIIDREREYGRRAFLNGLPSPIAFDVVNTEHGYGVIFEMAGAMTLSQYINKYPEKLEEYAVKMGNLLRQITTTQVDCSQYADIKDHYREYIGYVAEFFAEEEVATLHRMLDAIPQGSTLLHGDFHPKNIMIDNDGELVLIDTSDMCYGNPIFDVAGAYMAMVSFPRSRPDISLKYIGMEAEQCAKMWQIMFAAYTGVQDEAFMEESERRFEAFSDFRRATHTGGRSEAGRKAAPRQVAMLRQTFFPRADEICALLSES